MAVTGKDKNNRLSLLKKIYFLYTFESAFMEINTSFFDAEVRVGTIVSAIPFPEARKPAFQLVIDFGTFQRRSSAQITDLYQPSDLIGSQVVAVINLPPKRIAGFVSECLVLGVVQPNGTVVLLRPDRPVPDGLKIS